jgi:hypothetical protein
MCISSKYSSETSGDRKRKKQQFFDSHLTMLFCVRACVDDDKSLILKNIMQMTEESVSESRSLYYLHSLPPPSMLFPSHSHSPRPRVHFNFITALSLSPGIHGGPKQFVTVSLNFARINLNTLSIPCTF